MTKKNTVKICFFVLMSIGFFYLLVNKAHALGLEVKYPTIAGQTLAENTTLPGYVIYLFNGGMFVGFSAVFISLIIAGAMYLLSPIKADLLANAKDRISGAISGLLILALTYLIIITINPQLSILSLSQPPPTPPPTAEKETPGVYFYRQSDCSDISTQANASNVQDLLTLKNRVGSVKIVQDANAYVSILYDAIGLQGKCLYLTISSPDTETQCFPMSDFKDRLGAPVTPFADSASVHPYDFNSNGDGVYFYREDCFDKISSGGWFNNTNTLVSYCNREEVGGGYYRVDNSKINLATNGGKIYVGSLADLSFVGNGEKCTVPKEKWSCSSYNKNGDCIQKSCPTLAGENISSIIINGNYIVLFVYFGPNDSEEGPWTYCQEFPTANDANKLGPQQIKWQNIRNNGGVIPNYVIIVPIQGSK